MALRRVTLDNLTFSQFVDFWGDVLNDEFLTMTPGDRLSYDRAALQVIHDQVCMSRSYRAFRCLAALLRQPETLTLRSTGVFQTQWLAVDAARHDWRRGRVLLGMIGSQTMRNC
jgi:hypothetical protein